MSVKIITDSSSDLPAHIIEKYNIEVMPLLVNMQGKEYRDKVDVSPKEVYDYMRNEGVVKTAQITYGNFIDKFRECAKTDEQYIYIAFSSGLSGTYQTSKLAETEIKEEYPDFDFHIIDTKCASLGEGLVVYKAAKMASEGCSKDEILETIDFYKDHMEHIFTVEDLKYLFRGGRVSKTAAVMGTVLNIKPILDIEDGKLIPIEKIRGRKKSIKRMIEITQERAADFPNQVVGIDHGDDIEAAQFVKQKFEELGVKEIVMSEVGASVGAHSGPGTLGIYFLNKLQ